MIKRESIDKIIELAQIEEVVGDYVNLKRRGANMIGLCPFHNEKTPSFIVSPTKGIFKCFGCGESGNSIGFVMKHENLSFVDSVRLLAQKYNFELEETQDTEEEKQKRDERESLYIINKFAQEHYTHNLWETNEGKSVALSYFKERGFTKNTIEQFQLGWAKESFDDLFNAAKEKQYSPDLLQQNGLISVKNDRTFDFFRARVMFPIHNVAGKVVAFGGRTLSADKKVPKYVNTPETPIYSKSRVLYGMYQAKKAIRQQDNCYLVEGYTDVISLHQAGIENAVASSGTSLTIDQVKLVKRFTKNITLLFDGDAAGLKAALRGVNIILEQDLNVKIVPLPENEDPDSFVKSVGLAGFEEYVKAEAKDFILFKTDFLLQDGKNDPVKRSEATRSIIESIALIPDNIKRAFYIRGCATQLGIEEQLLHSEVNKEIRKNLKNKGKISRQDKQLLDRTEEAALKKQPQTMDLEHYRHHFAEKEILRILFDYGHLTFQDNITVSDYIQYELEDVAFKDETYNNLYKMCFDQNKSFSMKEILASEDEDLVETVINVIVFKDELSEGWWDKHEIRVKRFSEEHFAPEVLQKISRFKLAKLYEMILEREQQLLEDHTEEEEIKILQELRHLRALDIEYRKELNIDSHIRVELKREVR